MYMTNTAGTELDLFVETCDLICKKGALLSKYS